MTTHVHQAGLLDLRFALTSADRTYLAGRLQRFPLRITTPHYLDDDDRGMAFVIIQNPAGAVFAGDHLELRLEAEEGARVHLRTQSATRLCQMDGERATRCFVREDPTNYRWAHDASDAVEAAPANFN